MKKSLQRLGIVFSFFFLLFFFSYAQTTSTINGQVNGSGGEPLGGVTVQVKNTKTTTVTNPDGSFRINVPPNAILVFSYVGYREQELPVNGKQQLSVSLLSSNTALDEVVVIG